MAFTMASFYPVYKYPLLANVKAGQFANNVKEVTQLYEFLGAWFG